MRTSQAGQPARAHREEFDRALSNFDRPRLDPTSQHWLGYCCDRERVSSAGLWNSNHVDDRRRVIFVADPPSTPIENGCIYARPDNLSDSGNSWREVLLEYNNSVHNPLGLRLAYQLYGNRTYGRLVDRFGVEKVYILSAGWGLIKADFLTLLISVDLKLHNSSVSGSHFHGQ